GAILLDLENPLKIISKTPDFILEPEYDYEIEGYYRGCVFPTGNVIVDDTLYVYYGGADKYIGVATCNIHDFIKTFKKV
ncbi:MAG TPA: glycosidase, partial [Dysgonomonas sp.]|nr:glycosidase [Dysgonomonas sp.]